MVVTDAIDHPLPLGHLLDGTSIIDIISTQKTQKKYKPLSKRMLNIIILGA